jgi:isochorismate synthase
MTKVVLPALLMTVTAKGSWLTASVVLDSGYPGDDVAPAIAARWRTLAAAAGSNAVVPVSSRPSLRLVASRPGASEWRASVSRMAGAVGRGRLDKVVLARQVELEAASSIDVAAVMGRLRASAPESTLFAVGREGRTFLGASPERLVSVEGRHLRSIAMAGSVGRGGDEAADARLAAELLASDKEREEHAVVVDMLRATLTPLTDGLVIPSVPHVERLRHVQHLVTPVEGRLREPMDVLRLGELLHPTPAVGGMPRDLALELIAEEEQVERGWYAGPLGWVDRQGDGELVVALRSGVVEGRTATLLAGCGIVADSDPEREWQESTTKLLALGSALGRVEV